MPNYDKFRESKYVQKSEVSPPVLVTISHVTEDDVSRADQPTEMKFAVHFKEAIKPWIAPITMLELIHQIAGDGNTDHWAAEWRQENKLPPLQVVLYVDPNVTFGGKLVGGIRCKPPQTAPVAEPVVPPSRDEFDVAMDAEEAPF